MTFLLFFPERSQTEAKCLSQSKGQLCRFGEKVCPACIKVSWFIRPPYTLQKQNIDVGILPGNVDREVV